MIAHLYLGSYGTEYSIKLLLDLNNEAIKSILFYYFNVLVLISMEYI